MQCQRGLHGAHQACIQWETRMNRNRPIPTIELLMSAGILFLIVLVGWRFYQEISLTPPPSPYRPQPTFGPSLQPPPQDTQLPPEEYERIVHLEQEVTSLSVAHASQDKQMTRLMSLETEITANTASRALQKENTDRLITLEKEVAILNANQNRQEGQTHRLVTLEQEVAHLAATQKVQQTRTNGLGELEQKVATNSAIRVAQKEHEKRLLTLGKRLARVEQWIEQAPYHARAGDGENPQRFPPPFTAHRQGWRNNEAKSVPPLATQNEEAEDGSDYNIRSADDQDRRTKQREGAPVKTGYFIPSGCFLNMRHTLELENDLARWNFPSYRKKVQSNHHEFTCVFVGPIPTGQEAKSILATLQGNNLSKAFQVIRYHKDQ